MNNSIFFNTTSQPNLVNAVKHEINSLHVQGWTKREINYRFDKNSWNGSGYDRIIVSGQRKYLLEVKQR